MMREFIWSRMRHYGLPEKYVRIFQAFFNGTMSAVRVINSCNHEKVYLYIIEKQLKLRTPISNGFFCVQTTQSLTI